MTALLLSFNLINLKLQMAVMITTGRKSPHITKPTKGISAMTPLPPKSTQLLVFNCDVAMEAFSGSLMVGMRG